MNETNEKLKTVIVEGGVYCVYAWSGKLICALVSLRRVAPFAGENNITEVPAA